MRDETAGVTIEEFFGLKPKMYPYLIDDNSEHKKAKGVNSNLVATISYNEYKDVLSNKKYLRYVMNMIQSKNHKIKTYEINKIFLSCSDDKKYLQNDGCDELLVARVNYKKTVVLITIKKKVILITIKKNSYLHNY